MEQEYVPGQLEEFIRMHPGRGVLRVQVAAARGTFPVKGASVRVVKPIGGAVQEFYRGITDESGILDGMVLPAYPVSLSQNSVTAPDSGTDYFVSVAHPEYQEENAHRVTIYDQVETVLPVLIRPRQR